MFKKTKIFVLLTTTLSENFVNIFLNKSRHCSKFFLSEVIRLASEPRGFKALLLNYILTTQYSNV